MEFRNFASSAAIVAMVSIAPTLASAQAWLEDRDRAEGPGFRVGDFELHPGLGVELGYDSNVYYTSDNPSPLLPQRMESAILRVTPHLLVSSLGAQRRQEGQDQGGTPPDVTFRGGLSASYYEFFADETRRNVSLDLGLNLSILQGRPVSFSIFNELSRSIRPFSENTSQTSYARIREDAGVTVQFSTPGNIVQVGAGYQFGLDFFEGQDFAYASSFNHTITLTESFRFLPQTAVVHSTSVTIRDYFQPPSPTEAGRPALLDSVRVNSTLGVNGAITNEISFLLQGGYGAGFFDARGTYDQDFDSLTARAQLRWRPVESFRMALGYDRSFEPSFVGNYYSQDRGYLNGQLLLGGAFLLGAEASIGYYDFGQIVGADGVTPIGRVAGVPSTERNDIRFIGSLFAEYRFTDWLGVNGTFRYTGSFTDFQYDVPVGMTGTTVLDPAQYNKIELWLGVRVFY
jgi:hypothetical protein